MALDDECFDGFSPARITALEEAIDGYARQAIAVAATDLAEATEPRGFEHSQGRTHGVAWIAAYAEALRSTIRWYAALQESGQEKPIDRLLFAVGVGRYLDDMTHGIALSATETVRPATVGLGPAASELEANPDVAALIGCAQSDKYKRRLAEELRSQPRGELGSFAQDESLELIRGQFRRIAEDLITPVCSTWHARDLLIPDALVSELGEMGAYGITMPEQFGGSNLGLEAQCVVTEELSRGYLGAGSLVTRAEIACTLIHANGTQDQKRRYLEPLATGRSLATAVFTEPGAGSDLGSLKTRAVRDGDCYRISGAKTWITHAARADIMMVLARTDADQPGYAGLSMFVVEKPRGTDRDPFPAAGMSGGEIPVLGYRGMREYEISFDNFEVPASALLGGEEGQGFRQLMATFESARIQTAARALGVAHNALDLALDYAKQRTQFDRPIIEFSRIANKIANIAAEIMVVRQAVYSAARQHATGARCDVEAGMAKLLAARIAWLAADDSLQIHGGNGYALEFPISRVLCDSRILSVFEGAAEIQAHVVVRGLVARARNLRNA
ncbi:acyl-CoA/acyl-ACP dehydrogenase [Mesorhizobium sp. CO1-1-11]|uniref:acyl-CoA dehydrogenase family protein n=1 Tax=Mesorhizobium sp. CO1-1-11 TaxID=2876636 RepID=UPI001CCBE688|nr:acyl-CoA dehydrogenase family protein [Mesorhizobium sp. CO1-1-11]MBZ9726314.1 acyl-CoA/acyl-ACP dehydrogenase [Mesorhizobium sp. CO1-1-11]